MSKIIYVVLGIILIFTSLACTSRKHSSDKEALLSNTNDQLLTFSLDGISKDQKRRWNIQGDAVEIAPHSSVIDITKVVAKVFDHQGTIILTADKGKFDRMKNVAHVESNVIVTSSDGICLNTNSLDWNADTQQVATDSFITLQKDNLQVSGLGAEAAPDLKTIVFKQENTVLIQPNTVITCSGTLQIDYKKNIAIFKDDVIITDRKGRLFGDRMDVFFDPKTKKIAKAVAIGNVKIEQGQNNTLSHKAIYLTNEGKVILTGQPQLFIYPKQGS